MVIAFRVAGRDIGRVLLLFLPVYYRSAKNETTIKPGRGF